MRWAGRLARMGPREMPTVSRLENPKEIDHFEYKESDGDNIKMGV